MTTPAISQAKQLRLDHTLHQYSHDSNTPSFALEAADKLGIPAEQVFKTLVTQVDSKRWVIALVPASTQANMKRLAKAVGGKKASMAAADAAERITGYVLGGVSPLGQKKQHMTVIDQSALQFQRIFVSAGKRGLEIELAPEDLGNATQAIFAAISL